MLGGTVPTGTKVDQDTKDFIEAEAERLGISSAEFHRRLVQFYRESRRDQTSCPHCEKTIVMSIRESE